MKKFAIRSCSLIMALVLAIGLCISASATEFAPYASDYLSKYQGTVTAQGNGVVKISFLVIGTERIDEIGASKIVVQEKDGNSWIPVKRTITWTTLNSLLRTIFRTPIMSCLMVM